MVEAYKTINHLNPPYMWDRNISWESQLKYNFQEKSQDEKHLSSLLFHHFDIPITTKIRPKPVDIRFCDINDIISFETSCHILS